jgi:DNA invertase Pin-like site-specific DNA recombinase
MSEKVRTQHLSRKAILYIRQSSAYQVTHNLESQELQYAMQDRLRELGWREFEVVDEDLGRSAAGTVTRAGFERMVSEVCLGHVGAVAAREVSRFARNSREWQHLVEVCRVVDTVLIDQETVYAPRQSNDRLLLGLNRPDSQSTYCLTFLWLLPSDNALVAEPCCPLPGATPSRRQM